MSTVDAPSDGTITRPVWRICCTSSWMSVAFSAYPLWPVAPGMATPMTCPPTLRTGPPPVPESMTASVCSVSLSWTVLSGADGLAIEAGLCSALMMPRVTALP